MKKQIYTLIVLLFVSLSSLIAQTFKENFLGNDFMQYKGVYFKLKDNVITGLDYAFYEDIQFCQKTFDINVIYPEKKYKFCTSKDSLSNKIFFVENIIDKNGNNLPVGSQLENPIFILRDTASNKFIYYVYDKKSEINFPFLSSQILLDINFFCSKIEQKKDDFTNEVIINNPILEGGEISSMILYKRIYNSKVTYFLSLRTYGSTLNINVNGVIILFQDGTKMNKPTIKINVNYDKKGYEYNAYIPLSEIEVKSFVKKKFKKFRLYIHDKEIDSNFAEKFTYFTKCIIEKKQK